MLHKNWLYSSVTLSILLGACSLSDIETDEPRQLPDETEKMNHQPSDDQSHALIENAIAAESTLENYSANIKMTDFISFRDEQIQKVTDGTLSYQKEPEVIYSNFARYAMTDAGKIDQVEEALGLLKIDDMLISNHNNDGWEEINETAEVGSILSSDYSPQNQLSLLQGITEFVSVREYDDLYVLTIEATNEELDDMALHMDLFDQSLFGLEEIDLRNSSYQVSQLDFMLFIDKETYLLEKSNTVFEFIIDAPAEEYAVRKDLTVTRSSVNSPEGIQYPSVAQ
ncbi:DUF6612 family protein [Shouchella sp. JSM 1781072]|uniref:DUF6612 family protein n=1 Tax=Shouchella sp. JSM 1781072 TaxID=3344581 RepID=UPI0035BECBAE